MRSNEQGMEENGAVPPAELTDADKVEELKEQLKQGALGPADFEKEFQVVWTRIKEEENPEAAEVNRLRRINSKAADLN